MYVTFEHTVFIIPKTTAICTKDISTNSINMYPTCIIHLYVHVNVQIQQNNNNNK